MYCKTCGSQINDNQAICLNCGCEAGSGIKYCANCGSELNPNAVACMNCGVAKDFGAAKPKAATGVAGIDNNGWCPSDKQSIVAIVLAFFLGGLGIHNFYLGEAKKGILKLVLCWTGISSILALIDFIKMLVGSYTVDSNKLI